MRTGPRCVPGAHLGYFNPVALGGVLDPVLNLRVRPAPALRVQPGQVLHCYVCVILISNLYCLAGDALANLVLDPRGLSTDTLRLSPENLSVLISTVLLAKIRSLIQMGRQVTAFLLSLD